MQSIQGWNTNRSDSPRNFRSLQYVNKMKQHSQFAASEKQQLSPTNNNTTLYMGNGHEDTFGNKKPRSLASQRDVGLYPFRIKVCVRMIGQSEWKMRGVDVIQHQLPNQSSIIATIIQHENDWRNSLIIEM